MNNQGSDVGGHNLRSLTDAYDWSRSSLGARKTWPRSLETIIDMMLSSPFAMCLGWGSELTLLYNDAYVPFLGARHPSALGKPLQQVWAEVWPDIEPSIASALAGKPIGHEDLPLTMTRHGYPEETWWTFAYSPLRDDNGVIAGFLDIATETTAKIVHERELAAREAELRAFPIFDPNGKAALLPRAIREQEGWLAGAVT